MRGSFRARHIVLGVLIAALANLIGSVAEAQVIRTSTGSVEFLGLRKWTPAQIQQRLGYSSADQLHYCAADLKKIGFPEVSVAGYADRGHRDYVVTVVEPDRAKEVVYKSEPSGHLSLPPGWERLEEFTKDPSFLAGGILDYGRTLPGALSSQAWLSDGTPQSWWPTLRGFRKESDFKLAQEILEQSDDPEARAVSAIVLMNFASEDAAWQSLVSGLRDPNDLVSATCMQALNSLATYHSRKVDWASAVPDLIDLLHGTDLFAFPFVLKTLTVTKVDSALSRSLLGNGGARLALAYLGAKHEQEHDIAHRFLTAMAGRDLGDRPASWAKWVSGL